MANSSQSKSHRGLRVGVIQKGKVIEELLVRDQRALHVGTHPDNDLVVGPEGTPERFLLFEAAGSQGYVLHVGETMQAVVDIDDDTLEFGGGEQKELALADDVRGKIVMGATTVVFEFVDAPPLALLPPLPVAMRARFGYIMTVTLGLTLVLAFSLLLSIVIHGTLLGLGYIIPPPPRNAGELQLNARLTRMLQPVEPEETEPQDLEPDDNAAIVADTGEDEETSAGEEEETEHHGGGGAAGGDEANAMTGLQQVVQGSAVGALMDAEGGLNLGLVAAGSASEQSAADALANQQASGASGGGAVAQHLGGVGSGNGSGGGRIGVGGDGSSAVAKAAEGANVKANTKKDQVRVRAHVRDSGQRVAGSGTLSETEVKGVLGRFRRRVQRCYERTLAKNPTAKGRVELRFRVNDNGQTADARLPVNELGSTFGNCILTEVRRLRFSPPSGGPVTVGQRYILQPSQ